MNLYEFNKNMVNQLPIMTSTQLDQKELIINDYFNKNKSNHHMLLCSEYNYYTLFEKNNNLPLCSFSNAVRQIIQDLGDILSIELVDNDSAIEIWIRPIEEDECMVFYLFPYDAGVVYYG